MIWRQFTEYQTLSFQLTSLLGLKGKPLVVDMKRTGAIEVKSGRNNEVIAAYLSAALEDENPDLFLVAVKDVARARGMTQLAKDTGLGHESLYKALAPGAKPRYDTVLKVERVLGVRLYASATHAPAG